MINSQTSSLSIQQRNQILEEKLGEYIAREEALAAQEEKVAAREKELIDLYAELVKEKKALMQNKTNKAASQKNHVNNHKIQKTIPKRKQNHEPDNNQVILGEIEKVYLDPPGMVLDARIDTGAQTSSLNAIDMVEFERDGEPFVKFHITNPETNTKIELTRRVLGHVRVKEHNRDSQKRPIVKLRVKIASIEETIKFTLVDRSKFRQQILIGRNFLRDLAIVDVSKKFSVPSPEIKESKSN